MRLCPGESEGEHLPILNFWLSENVMSKIFLQKYQILVEEKKTF